MKNFFINLFYYFLPKRLYLNIFYYFKTKRFINFKNPKRFTEKIQVYKIHYKNELLTKTADKYGVREYIKEKGLEDILNEIYGVYENPKDIDFSSLPNEFVIKLNTGSGKNLFIKDKANINIENTIKKLEKWKNISKAQHRHQWAYEGIKPLFIIEKLLPRDANNDIPDYKFFCFDGKVEYLYIMTDYLDGKENGKLSFFDTQFNKTKYHRDDYKEILAETKKPENFEQMIEYAKILSSGLPHVRVDLYNINGKIIFGELTYYTSEGYINFLPDEFDYILGENFLIK